MYKRAHGKVTLRKGKEAKGNKTLMSRVKGNNALHYALPIDEARI